MVSRTCLRPGLFLGLLIWSMTASAASLQVTLDQHALVLGEALAVSVRGDNLGVPLVSLDLAVLQTDFDIYTRSTDRQTRVVHGQTQVSETLSMLLYPLRTGQLLMPALHLAGHSSAPISVTVAASGGDTPPVLFKLSLHPQTPMTRQVARLTLEIADDGSLQWSQIKLPEPAGVYLRELAAQESTQQQDGVTRTLHRQSWALMPLKPGKVTLTLPMAAALKFGTRLRYALPTLTFDAASAPAYLPVYVPIGKLSASMQPLADELRLNQPASWVIQVRGTGLSAAGLVQLLPPLPDTEALHFYPAQVSLLADTGKQLIQTWQVSIPFVPLRTGQLTLPERVLAYYDPDRGLQTYVLAAQRVTVVNPLWASLRRIGILSVVGLVLVLGMYWVGKIARRWLIRRALLHRVSNASDWQQLKQAVLAFDWGDSTFGCASLQRWLAVFAMRYGQDAALASALSGLEAGCYSSAQSQIDLPAVRLAVWRVLRAVKRQPISAVQ